MKSLLQNGDIIPLVAPYDRLAGQGALVGSIFGVAVNDVLSTVTNEFATKGVHSLAKVSAQAWTQGALLYWDDSAKNVTSTSNSGANKLIGTAAQVAANPSSTGYVRLNGAFST